MEEKGKNLNLGEKKGSPKIIPGLTELILVRCQEAGRQGHIPSGNPHRGSIGRGKLIWGFFFVFVFNIYLFIYFLNIFIGV